MKIHNIDLDSSFSNYSSHGYALFASCFSFNAISTSSSNYRLTNSRASYHMVKDKVNPFVTSLVLIPINYNVIV
jgi:hypothetical protein